MSANGCNPPHPLLRDGASKQARVPAALSPNTAKLDNRNMADLLDWLVRYAGELIYYDRTNGRAGDWSALLERDVAF